MALPSNTMALLGKELRTEFRSGELLTTTVVFILIVIVLFSFTFEPTSDESRRFGPGLLWLAFLFAASLMLQPCFLREQNNDTLSALRLSVRDPFAIFLAKLVANTLFLLFTEVLMLPVFAILFNVPVLPVLGQLLSVFFLAPFVVSLAPARSGGQHPGDRRLVGRVALYGMEGPWLPGNFRRGLFDRAMAFRRISSGGIMHMKKQVLVAAIVFLLLGAAAYGAFFVAPTERTMGPIQRIFYLHVASAWTGLCAFFICFIANVLYVFRRQPQWDWLSISAAEVGLSFTPVVLVSGPIWAHPVWGIWWTWDARLTSTFILWLLYACFLLLRTLVEEPDRRALFSALFGIFAFLDVPLVFGSIRWWRTQHPQPVVMGGAGPGLAPTMWKVLFFSWFAMLALMALLMRARYLMEAARGELEMVRREAGAV